MRLVAVLAVVSIISSVVPSTAQVVNPINQPTAPVVVGQTEAERLSAELNDPRLFDVQEGLYAGDPDFILNIHLRKGLGWPQTATVVIHRPTGRLLMGVLVSLRDYALDRVTAVFVDEGFMTTGAPDGRLIQADHNDAGSRFYEAYKRARRQRGPGN